MPDNLTVEISANTQKFRYELTKLQNDLKGLGKQLRDAVKAGDEAGGMALSKTFEQTRASIARLNKELSNHKDVVKETGDTWAETGLKIKEALAAFAALEGVRKVADAFSETAKKISETSDTAKLIGANANDIKVLQTAIEQTGSSADGSKEAIARLAEALADARAKARAAGTAMEGGVNVLRGSIGGASEKMKQFNEMLSGVNVARGGVRNVMSVADAVDVLKERMGKFQPTEEGARKAIEGLFADLAKIRKADASLGTAVGIEFLGKRYAAFAEGVDKLGNSKAWQEIRKGLEAKGLLISSKDQDNVDEYNKKLAELNESWEALQKKATMPLFPTLNEGIRLLSEAVDQVGKLGERYAQLKNVIGANALEDAIVGPIRRGLDSALDKMRQWGEDAKIPLGDPLKLLADLLKTTVDLVTGNLSGAFKDFGTLANDVWKTLGDLVAWVGTQINDMIDKVKSTITWVGTLGDKISAAAAAISALPGTTAAGDLPPMPAGNAAGGLIRGPGTGTSDSVLARLSNGEFVMRAAAVQHWGTSFMQALNGMSAPLMPRRGRAHFADGGLVTATTADGVTVNLHFPGGTFALRGDKGIVQGLTREARRASMLSAGRAPGVAVA
jgi:uncharacterized phage infection (PIP) family protein YhgE